MSLYNQSKPLDQRIKELESQKGVFVYDWECGQSDVQSTISSWDQFHARLADSSTVVPAGESSVAANPDPAAILSARVPLEVPESVEGGGSVAED